MKVWYIKVWSTLFLSTSVLRQNGSPTYDRKWEPYVWQEMGALRMTGNGGPTYDRKWNIRGGGGNRRLKVNEYADLYRYIRDAAVW
jgi:hypothetical protein